jgi:hypothetical protein
MWAWQTSGEAALLLEIKTIFPLYLLPYAKSCIFNHSWNLHLLLKGEIKCRGSVVS